MFKIASAPISKDRIIVTHDYQSLIWYDGDALYTGYNAADERIIAILVEDEGDGTWYFFAIISDHVYADCKAGFITLRAALREASCIVAGRTDQSDATGDSDRFYPITFADIPEEYLPSATSLLKGSS